MKTVFTHILFALIISALVGFYCVYAVTQFRKTMPTTKNEEVIHPQFTLPEYGLSFSYPEEYFIAREENGFQGDLLYSVMLAQNNPEVRSFFANPVVETEEPISFLVTIHNNSEDSLNSLQYFKKYVQGPTVYNNTIREFTLGSDQGVEYLATGLFENKNLLIARPDFTYIFTVYYNTPTERVLFDFPRILQSVTFIDPEMTFDLPQEPPLTEM